jgi:hypothetical protein
MTAASTAARRLVASITLFGEITNGVSITFASVVALKLCTVVWTGDVVARVGSDVEPVCLVGETTQRLLLPVGVENGSLSPTLTVPPDTLLWPTMVTKFSPCRTGTGAFPPT